MAEALGEWVNQTGFAIDALARLPMGDGANPNHWVESLRALAGALHAHFAAPAEVLYDDEQALVEGVVAYVGDVVLVASRGQWDWNDAPGYTERLAPVPSDAELVARLTEHRWTFGETEYPGVPVVVPNAALGLEPVSPLHLLLAELGDEPGAVVAGVERYQRAIAAHAATQPEWNRFTEPIPTDGMPTMPPSPILDQWLDERGRDFPRWAGTFGGTWDFTHESVDRLATLVLRTTPTKDTFRDPANAYFADGASWYFGELLNRAGPARWMYSPVDLEEGDPPTVAVIVQKENNRDYTIPFIRITNMLRRNDPDWLRVNYDKWAKLA